MDPDADTDESDEVAHYVLEVQSSIIGQQASS